MEPIANRGDKPDLVDEMHMTPGLERKLIRSILLLSVAGVLIVGVTAFFLSAFLFLDRMKEGARSHVSHDAQSGAQATMEFLQRSTDVVWQITSRSLARTLLEDLNARRIEPTIYRQRTETILLDALKRSNHLRGLTRLDRLNNPVASIGEIIPTEYLPQPTQASESSVVRGPFEFNGVTRIIIHAPILDNRGGWVGTDVASFGLEELAKLLQPKHSDAPIGRDVDVFLAVRNGASTTYLEPLNEAGEAMRPTTVEMLFDTGDGDALQTLIGGQVLSLGKHHFAAREIVGANWHVLVRESTERLYAGVYRDILISFSALVALTVLGALGLLTLIRRHADRLSNALGGLRTDVEVSRARYEDLIEGSIQGIMIHRGYKPLLVNKAWAEMHGQSVEEVMALGSIKGFISADDQDRMEAYRQARMDGEPAPELYEYRAIHRDGSEFWVEIVARPIVWKGEIAIQATVADISERKRQEALDAYYRAELEGLVKQRTAEIEQKTKGLEAALQKEREYNALMEQFVAMASHEFRTPLTIIDSIAQRMFRRAERLGPEDIKHGALKARGAVQRMINLIEGLLHSARMDAGKLTVNLKPCCLGEIVQRVCDREREISPRHEIAVELQDLPHDFVGDPTLLEQVFGNLLSNATKYSPDRPFVKIETSTINGVVSVAISDRGVGIPQDEIPKLFDRFFRASTSSGIAGTGIGLNLVSQIVELHGGRITVKSVENEGSVFTVDLPMNAVAAATHNEKSTFSSYAGLEAAHKPSEVA